MLRAAAQYGHLDVVQYALDNGCPGRDDLMLAAVHNCSTLEYLLSRDFPLLPQAYVSAATSSHPLRSVKLLRAKGCPWDVQACNAFAARKLLDCLKFAHENGAPWDATTTAAAARLYLPNTVASREERDALDCLRFLHESGCPWDNRTCLAATDTANCSCLEYAREHGCPWNCMLWRVAGERPSDTKNAARTRCLDYMTLHNVRQCPSRYLYTDWQLEPLPL